MNLAEITPLVLTYNEAPNIGRCLERLQWASRLVVVDSESADDTGTLAGRFSNAAVVARRFDDHTSQWNFGVQQCGTNWILALDADYMLCPGFEQELAALTPADKVDAYYARFRYVIAGQPLRGSLYPPRAVLFRKDRCTYRQDGHTQLLHIPGETAFLTTPIDHDDRKSLSRWVVSQDKYAQLEVTKLASQSPSSLRIQDKLRLALFPAPLLALFYTLIVKQAMLDGWRGWYYALQRMMAESILSLRLLEKRWESERKRGQSPKDRL